MRMRGLIWQKMTAVLLISLLASCRSTPTRLFTLDAVAPNAVLSAYAGPAVQVEDIHVPPSLDRLEIVTTMAPDELRIHDLEHWGAPLSRLIRQALSEDLVARLPPGKVVFPDIARPPGVIGMHVDVLAFEAGPHDAHLTIGWTMSSDNAGVPNREGTAELRAVGENMTVPHAWSVLVAEFSARVVDDLGTEAAAAGLALPGDHRIGWLHADR